MFLALKELQALGAPIVTFKIQLSRVQTAIPLFQSMILHQSDHNHENVVKSAGKLLEHFPNHPEGRRALKESGLIFLHLAEGLLALNSCFVQDASGKPSIIKASSEGNERSTDYSRVLILLQRAEKSVAEAKKLDPLFDKAIQLERTIRDTSNSLGYLVCLNLVSFETQLINLYLEMFNSLNSVLQSSISSRYSSPSSMWKIMQPNVAAVNGAAKRSLEQVDGLSSQLVLFKGQSEPDAISVAIEIHEKAVQIREAITDPAGSVIDYGRDVSGKTSEFKSLLRKFNSALPTSEQLQETLAGFGTAASTFQLFKTPADTRPYLNRHKAMILI